MQTYVAQKAHRQLPAGHKHALEINQPDAASSAAVAQMGEMLNRSPRVRAQMQLQRMLNQSPAVVAQTKLAKTLSRRSTAQRESLPVGEELAQAKFEPAQRQGEALREAEEEETLQGKFEPVQRETTLDEEARLQGKFDSVQRQPGPDSERPQQREPNRTGLPDNLKTGVEALSGFSLSDVRVHYNSPQPAQLSALAYAQGTDIHVGPGQEQHLPHEAWHVVQQKQGRVKPTLQMKGVAINNDAGLEREADVMAGRAGHWGQVTLQKMEAEEKEREFNENDIVWNNVNIQGVQDQDRWRPVVNSQIAFRARQWATGNHEFEFFTRAPGGNSLRINTLIQYQQQGPPMAHIISCNASPLEAPEAKTDSLPQPPPQAESTLPGQSRRGRLRRSRRAD